MSNKLKSRVLNQKSVNGSKPKIVIGVPANRDFPKETVASLMTLASRVGTENVILMMNGMINQCRDAIVVEAIKRNADYIFWVDDDMVIPSNAIDKLLAHNKDIVSGIYFGRSDCQPVMFDVNIIRTEDGLIEYAQFYKHNDYADNSLMKIGAIGFGCVLTKVSAMKKIYDEWGTCFDFLFGKGEDLSFAVRAEDMGIETWVDTSVKCGHIGRRIVCEEHWKVTKDNLNSK